MADFFYRHLSEARRKSMPVVQQSTPAERVYLDGAEIVKMMPSGQLEGVKVYGNPYTIQYTADGRMSGVAGHSPRAQLL